MDLIRFQQYAADNTWLTILPEISLGVLALALLVADLLLPPDRQRLIPLIALWGQVLVLFIGVAYSAVLISPDLTSQITFSGMLEHTMRGEVMRLFFLICSILVCFLGNIYLVKQQLPKVEFFHLVIVVTAGLMLLAQSHSFVMLFVALEAVTVGFYVLVAYCRKSSYSLEAGLKYLILSAVSSATLLFGIVLLYGAAGSPGLPQSTGNPMDFSALQTFIDFNNDHPIVLIGAVLVICGIAFKIGAVPFQIWIPDVYQGAPTPVTAFLAVASKAGGFIVLLNLVTGPFRSLGHVLVPLLSTIAILTILFGNLAALTQRNVKRLMGLSGIAHAGYMLVGVVAVYYVNWAANAVIFYLVTYLLASFAVFTVMALLSQDADEDQQLDDYADLMKEHPFLAGGLVLGLGSLAGIPPLAGFIGKLLLFLAAFQAELYLLLAVSIVGVIMSIYYYFGWILSAVYKRYVIPGYEDEFEVVHPNPTPGYPHRVVLGTLSALTVIVGIYQGALSFLL